MTDRHATDYVHTCASGNTSLDNEDKFNIAANPAAVANKLAGRTAGIEGARLQSITPRGNNELTHTTRQRQVYIDFKEQTWSENPTN